MTGRRRAADCSSPPPPTGPGDFRSSLETLLRMGVVRERAEKALVSTGNRGVHLATDWLASHVDDPTLDEASPRHFHVCLCAGPGSGLPGGPEDNLPRVAVSEPAPVDDSKAQDFVARVARVASTFREGLSILKCGFEVGEGSIAALAVAPEDRPLVDAFRAELGNGGRRMDLAPGFEKVDELPESTDLSEWEVRLYSADRRFSGGTALRVARDSRGEAELELSRGDVLYADPALRSGLSWLTGRQGSFNPGCTRPALEHEGWTLHFSLPLKGDRPLFPEAPSAVERLRRLSRPPQPPPAAVAETGGRKVFIMRHGERVDFTFGPSWIRNSFCGAGRYSRRDLNMPPEVPRRRPELFARDCPLTRMGRVQARLTGEAMRESGVRIHHVFSSPSLRCVETAHGLLAGLGSAELKIHVEPGLFEWLAWYQDGMPDWMPAEDLGAHGFNVDDGYEPYISVEELRDTQAQLQQAETVEQYYTRNSFVTRCILQATEDPGGNLLVVGHAATLDACSRQVTGRDPRSLQQMMKVVRKVGYCGVAFLQEGEEAEADHPDALKTSSESLNRSRSSLQRGNRKVYQLREPPFPPITNGSNPGFDWTSLVADGKD